MRLTQTLVAVLMAWVLVGMSAGQVETWPDTAVPEHADLPPELS